MPAIPVVTRGRTTAPAGPPRRDGPRRRLVAGTILGLLLVSAALDRRNIVHGRETAEPQRAERASPALAELVGEMLTHD